MKRNKNRITIMSIIVILSFVVILGEAIWGIYFTTSKMTPTTTVTSEVEEQKSNISESEKKDAEYMQSFLKGDFAYITCYHNDSISEEIRPAVEEIIHKGVISTNTREKFNDILGQKYEFFALEVDEDMDALRDAIEYDSYFNAIIESYDNGIITKEELATWRSECNKFSDWDHVSMRKRIEISKAFIEKYSQEISIPYLPYLWFKNKVCKFLIKLMHFIFIRKDSDIEVVVVVSVELVYTK